MRAMDRQTQSQQPGLWTTRRVKGKSEMMFQRLVDRLFSATVVFCAFLAFLRAQFDGTSSMQEHRVCDQHNRQHPSTGSKPRVVDLYAVHGRSDVLFRQHKATVATPKRVLLEDKSPRQRGNFTDKSENQDWILDSDEYAKKGEPMYSTDPPCEPMHSWQMQTNPVCNLLHEKDMTNFFRYQEQQSESSNGRNEAPKDILHENVRYLAAGGYREVYMIQDDAIHTDWKDNRLALKTLKYSRNFTERHTDRHRRDAVAADRLTSTPESVNIYGFCGNSALYQFAKGGNLRDAIARYISNPATPEAAWSTEIRLQIAYQVASGIAAVHNVDEEGRASLAHTDISTDQFISLDGRIVFKINDFNRARFLRKNSLDNSSCPFTVKSNKGKFRAPEEYRYDPETEAIDVYSMGNIFFVLLTGKYPFGQFTKKAVKRAVARGLRPDFGALVDSADPHVQTLIQAARMCWTHDPSERATARQVQLFLQSKLPPSAS
ncbi:activated protein kinase kinase kinase 7 [Seminavis robusta]|uniref:Activated protein kinase kinase kinase 7 n=1 Tax=Seminavis robusta TaxID=568900 RepID=A0A9N8EUH3_9STRA|nr:activated protein kinase kinase kinase 7 [Seminavis robusta]|eukprot:Sro1854_g301870.1 activated protein kinase kinase kinase 7 (489) ;mRNA; f:9522-11077